ncbi:MAG: hypothetical protein RBU27_07065 [Bacteroidota bacterium]|jgi:nitrogen regulatory protein PII|nr:hypothetical protein [Bacteroidota bacterium]
MKAVMIIYNQTVSDKIDFILDHLELRGFTTWKEVSGRGSVAGEPRMGTHTWPEQNAATLVVVPDGKVDALLEGVEKLDRISEEVGVRAFVWGVERSY